MDSARYYVALVMVVATPTAIPFWFLVHPFIGFWRKVGLWITYPLQLCLMILIAIGLYLVRDWLLAVEFSTNYFLIALAIAVWCGAVYVERQCRRRLPLRVLIGVPELAPNQSKDKLLTAGIYSHIRHPRYVGIMLGMLAYALFTNYLGVYIAFVAWVIAILCFVPLEERELRARVIKAYEEDVRHLAQLLNRPLDHWLT